MINFNHVSLPSMLIEPSSISDTVIVYLRRFGNLEKGITVFCPFSVLSVLSILSKEDKKNWNDWDVAYVESYFNQHLHK